MTRPYRKFINKLWRDLRGSAKRLGSDRCGSVLLNFALAAIPLFAMGALAVDYGRALSAKQQLQRAVDSAALAIAQDYVVTNDKTAAGVARRSALALNVLRANIASGALATAVNAVAPDGTNLVTENASTGDFTVSLNNAQYATSLMLAPVSSLIGRYNAIPLSASATASTAGVIGSNKTLELALALDNTGSMVNDMSGLQTAATSLVNTVISATGNNNKNGNVRISVVPYVAAVNPGITDLTMIDTTHVNPFNGRWFQWNWLASNSNCIQSWPSSGSSSGGSNPGPGTSSSGDAGTSGSMIDMMDLVSPFRRVAQELFGVKGAMAQTATAPSPQITPSTTWPYSTTNYSITVQDPNTKKSSTVNVQDPAGFGYVPPGSAADTGTCAWLTDPNAVNVYELFSRVSQPNGNTVAWKGCVEARFGQNEISQLNNWGLGLTANSDYDVTDYPPTAGDNLSLFVPYFAPSEPSYSYTTSTGATAHFHNFYLNSVWNQTNWQNNYSLGSWSFSDWTAGRNLLNYSSQNNGFSQNNAAQFSENGSGWTYGPNAYCPDPVLPLTTSQTTVLNKISNLTFWYGGGTIISEGLMWGWRTLSPNKPYANGQAYGTANNQKVIVLMTDGVNGLAENGDLNGPHISDFSAYGYLGGDRLQYLATAPLYYLTGTTTLNPALTIPTPPSDATPPVAAGSVTTYDAVQTFFDDRMLNACANAKAAGITIYTVLFDHSASGNALTTAQRAHSLSLLQQCASNVNYTYLAADATSLNSAFQSIGNSVTNARVKLKM